MIYAGVEPSDLVHADAAAAAAAALSDVTNATATAGKATSGQQAARHVIFSSTSKSTCMIHAIRWTCLTDVGHLQLLIQSSAGCRKNAKPKACHASSRPFEATFVQRNQDDPKDSVFVHHSPSSQLLPAVQPPGRPSKAVRAAAPAMEACGQM